MHMDSRQASSMRMDIPGNDKLLKSEGFRPVTQWNVGAHFLYMDFSDRDGKSWIRTSKSLWESEGPPIADSWLHTAYDGMPTTHRVAACEGGDA